MSRVTVVGLPESSGIPYRNEGFARHAAPQAIEAHLKRARANLRQAERVVAWLEDLLAERKAQVEDGTWPPPKEDAP